MERRALFGLVVAGALASAGCRRRRSPEERVRAVLRALEEAVEDEDVDAVRPHLSARFTDHVGGDRAGALATLRAIFWQRAAPHLLVDVRALGLDLPGEATAELLVGVASLAFDGFEAVPRLGGALYRFSLALAEEEPRTWRVTSAAWEPVGPEAPP